MAIVLGLQMKLKRGASGAAANATTDVSGVRDVTLNLEKGEADVTTRDNNGWRAYVGTLKDATLEFELVHDPVNQDYKDLLNAFLNGTVLAFFISDGSGNGLIADWVITGFNNPEPLEEASTISVTARPTLTSRPPAWEGAS